MADDPPFLAVYTAPDRHKASVWTGPCPYPLRGKCDYECGAVGCDTRLLAYQNPDTAVVNLFHHKCSSGRKHTAAMRDWTTKYMETVRFAVRYCPVCKTEPTRLSKPYKPFPHMRIHHGSVLIVDITVHKLRLLVFFTELRWRANLPPPDSGNADDDDWTVVELRQVDPDGGGALPHTDMIPPLDVGHHGRYTRKPCCKCRTKFALPLIVPVARCVTCGGAAESVALDATMEIPLQRESTWRRRFRVGDGATFGVEAHAAKRRKTADAMVWKLPLPPDTKPTLVQGTMRLAPDCLACRPPPMPRRTPTPPPPSEHAIEQQMAEYLSVLDPSPANPLVACGLCGYTAPPTAFALFDRFPSFRHDDLRPGDGSCYLCDKCHTSCSDCGGAAIRELNSLCDDCFFLRYPDGIAI